MTTDKLKTDINSQADAIRSAMAELDEELDNLVDNINTDYILYYYNIVADTLGDMCDCRIAMGRSVRKLERLKEKTK